MRSLGLHASTSAAFLAARDGLAYDKVFCPRLTRRDLKRSI